MAIQKGWSGFTSHQRASGFLSHPLPRDRWHPSLSVVSEAVLCPPRPADLVPRSTSWPGSWAAPVLIRPVTGGRTYQVPTGCHWLLPVAVAAPRRDADTACHPGPARPGPLLRWRVRAAPQHPPAAGSLCGMGDSAGDRGGLKPVPPTVTPQLLRLECRGSSSQQCCCF